MFKLQKIQPYVVSIPLKSPIKMAGIVVETADNLIVRATDSDGNVGWGEASSAPTMTGETPESMLAAARFIAPRIEGLEVEDLSHIHHQVDAPMYGNHGAKAAIEIALLDIAGKRSGKPIYELLGGARRGEARILAMIAGGDLETEKANARKLADAGFDAFKVKIGILGADLDLERSAAARSVLGEDMQISADANQGYTRDDALDFARGARQAGLNFMEQLLPGSDIEGMAACAEETDVPLGADEGIHSLNDLRIHKDAGAAKGASLKPIKLGGLFPVLEAANWMNANGMHINLAGKVAESTIASAAVAHVALALPQLDWDTSITHQYLAEDLTDDPLKIENGVVRLDDRPGLGWEPSEERLQRYQILQ